MPVVMDADRICRTLTRIAHEILERNRGVEDLALVGIRTRACRSRAALRASSRTSPAHDVPTGALDITLYRDDLMRHAVGPQPLVRSTEFRSRSTAARILLVDDVLYTGRTTRAALDALIDFGRPQADSAGRAGRSRPPRAADQGRLRRQERADLAEQSVQVRLQEIDGRDEVSSRRRSEHRSGAVAATRTCATSICSASPI